MTAPHEALQGADHVLLDFDGPVCAAFSTITDGQIAEALRRYLNQQGWPVSDELRTIIDPLDILANTADVNADMTVAFGAELTHWEHHAVHCAASAPGVREVLVWLAATRRTVTIVSNNAPSPPRATCTRSVSAPTSPASRAELLSIFGVSNPTRTYYDKP